MKQIRTHYDNLKVAQHAPIEVIRAAYRTLSQKFHPDRNPGNPEAARIMVIINTSYEVLSDPDKRNEHDQWIAQQELLAAQNVDSNRRPGSTPQTAKTQPPPLLRFNLRGIITHIFRYWLLYGIACLALLVWATDKPSAPPPSPKPYNATPAPVREEYVRPVTAPNGQPWPVSAGYIKGYKRLHSDGLSTVKIDNSRNDSDVFVKLVC
jgi:hypothetical protein